jgi:hypothetical protein
VDVRLGSVAVTVRYAEYDNGTVFETGASDAGRLERRSHVAAAFGELLDAYERGGEAAVRDVIARQRSSRSDRLGRQTGFREAQRILETAGSSALIRHLRGILRP